MDETLFLTASEALTRFGRLTRFRGHGGKTLIIVHYWDETEGIQYRWLDSQRQEFYDNDAVCTVAPIVEK